MVELGQDDRFLAETLEDLGPARELGTHDLDGDIAIEVDVHAPEHLPNGVEGAETSLDRRRSAQRKARKGFPSYAGLFRRQGMNAEPRCLDGAPQVPLQLISGQRPDPDRHLCRHRGAAIQEPGQFNARDLSRRTASVTVMSAGKNSRNTSPGWAGSNMRFIKSPQ